MKSLHIVLLFFLLIITTGCSHYSDITGKVVDNATGKPIEGAVVVAQWTNTRGIPGLQYHNLHKIVETLTDKEGAFSLSGASGFIINPPDMIIYKEGYIPWRNDSIFPDKNTGKKEWNNNVTYKLDVFSNKYTYNQLSDFIDSGVIGLSDVPIFHKFHRDISRKAFAEIDEKKSKQQKP